MCASDNFSSAQSAYRRHYPTETALLHTLDSIYRSSDKGRLSLLVSLDLSAAFDTTDHRLLLDKLNESFGVCTAHSWLRRPAMLGLMGFSGSLLLYVIHRYYIFVY